MIPITLHRCLRLLFWLVFGGFTIWHAYLFFHFRARNAKLPRPWRAVEFDADKCAELHNKLLAATIESIPGAEERLNRDMISRMKEQTPWLLEVPEGHSGSKPEDLPIYRFFSQINTHSDGAMPLSGYFEQPDPQLFYSQDDFMLEEDGRHIILLYQGYPLLDQGLFLNLEMWTAAWVGFDDTFNPPEDPAAWVPLQTALEKSLNTWNRGKYRWNRVNEHGWGGVSFVSWTKQDLQDAVEAWEMLLEEIRTRLPRRIRNLDLQEPLPADLFEDFPISPFAKAFLTAAKRPKFPLVGPGMTTFTQDSFREMMTSEAQNSPRRKFIDGIEAEGHDIPSLVIPAAAPSIPMDPRAPGDQFFDKDWGVGKFTISRRAGLYTNPLYASREGDSTMFITAEGASQPIDFEFARPWGPGRSASFAEMFRVWAGYVRDGEWQVGPNGVSTPHSWFTDPKSADHRALVWTAAGECR